MVKFNNGNPGMGGPVPRTVLLVDDEGPIREFGKEILDHFGFSTLTAPNGEEALKIFSRQREKIDLVILDVNMPGMGGFQCLRELLQIDPATRVVVASGYSSSVDVQEMLQMGAAGFIAKPFRFEDFVNRLHEILDSPQ